MINKDLIASDLKLYYVVNSNTYGSDFDILRAKIISQSDEVDFCDVWVCDLYWYKIYKSFFYLKECFLTIKEAQQYREKLVKQQIVIDIIE